MHEPCIQITIYPYHILSSIITYDWTLPWSVTGEWRIGAFPENSSQFSILIYHHHHQSRNQEYIYIYVKLCFLLLVFHTFSLNYCSDIKFGYIEKQNMVFLCVQVKYNGHIMYLKLTSQSWTDNSVQTVKHIFFLSLTGEFKSWGGKITCIFF